MTSHIRARSLAITTAFAVSIAALGLTGLRPAEAHDDNVASLRIRHPWSPPTPDGAPTAAAYLTITNTGKQADHLVGVTTAAADRVEAHHMSMSHGVMSMRPIQWGQPIGPGQTVTFAPGGDHLMLIGLKRRLVIGQRLPVTLQFERAGAIKIELAVEPRPATSAVAMGHASDPVQHMETH